MSCSGTWPNAGHRTSRPEVAGSSPAVLGSLTLCLLSAEVGCRDGGNICLYLADMSCCDCDVMMVVWGRTHCALGFFNFDIDTVINTQ